MKAVFTLVEWNFLRTVAPLVGHSLVGISMDNTSLPILKSKFDQLINHVPTSDNEDIEFWYARDIMELLGYVRWENFSAIIAKAISSCESTGMVSSDHFRSVTKMIPIGKGGTRGVSDFMLTRYACYLIAQNGDPRKQEIAFAQSYFAVQTRKQEVIEDRMKLHARLDARERLREAEKALSRNIYERGVDDKGFGRIRSKGDQALFGGITTKNMKARLGVTESRPLADFLPTLTIAAKNLATEMTNHNVTEQNYFGEDQITQEHVQNNSSVREMLGKRGIRPENLPAAEDIKKLERRVKSDEKKLAKSVKLPNIAKD